MCISACNCHYIFDEDWRLNAIDPIMLLLSPTYGNQTSYHHHPKLKRKRKRKRRKGKRIYIIPQSFKALLQQTQNHRTLCSLAPLPGMSRHRFIFFFNFQKCKDWHLRFRHFKRCILSTLRKSHSEHSSWSLSCQ